MALLNQCLHTGQNASSGSVAVDVYLSLQDNHFLVSEQDINFLTAKDSQVFIEVGVSCSHAPICSALLI